MRILTDNKAKTSNTTVNGVTTAFPASNLYSNILIEKTYFDDYIDIDFGSATTIDSIGLISSATGITVSANSTASWGAPPFTTTITNQVTFINQSYRYWRIAKSGTNKINYLYLGEYMQLDCMQIGSTPLPNVTDITNFSIMGTTEQTRGIVYNTQPFRFPLATEAEWTVFDTWYRSNDRINAHLIVPFESDTPIESYFANIFNYAIPNRDKSVYDYSFSVREAK
jgi:hypothetical protein